MSRSRSRGPALMAAALRKPHVSVSIKELTRLAMLV